MGNPLEHAEHISHAGHGHGDEHGGGGGHGGDHDAGGNLGTYIGITMAVLGVVLAFCAARVGAERTELIRSLVEQQHAHAKYQAQDVKHRMAILNLRQTHAMIPAAEITEALDADLHKIEAAASTPAPAPAKPEAAVAGAAKPEAAKADPASGAASTTAAARALGKLLTAEITPSKAEAAKLSDTADRYFNEAKVANTWVESFNPAIEAHMEAQEHFELAQLIAEVGIVIASVALLLRKRIIWFAAVGLGVASLGLVGFTLNTTGSLVHAADEKIEEHGKEYRDLRNADKAAETDEDLQVEVEKWTGIPRRKAPAAHGEGHGAEKPAGHGEKPAHGDEARTPAHH
jgi:Domain of unknown function (DUF4337)